MRWRLHVIGVSLSMMLAISAGNYPSAPAEAQGQAIAELKAKLIEVRQDRAEIDAEWKETVRKLAERMASPPAAAVRQPRSVAYTWTAPRRRFRAAAPSTGIWSAEAERARQARRDWIDSELARRQE